jgi:hypothetical protein
MAVVDGGKFSALQVTFTAATNSSGPVVVTQQELVREFLPQCTCTCTTPYPPPPWPVASVGSFPVLQILVGGPTGSSTLCWGNPSVQGGCFAEDTAAGTATAYGAGVRCPTLRVCVSVRRSVCVSVCLCDGVGVDGLRVRCRAC